VENSIKEKTQAEDAPLVSICVITYNHEKYIRQCLDGIFMQKVDFTYEVLVHDDASPDGTADIIREYEAKYPDIIKPIYQTENQYSKDRSIISRLQYGRAKGKYIAQCEGDDYWTDPGKLQMQVDFLEAHPEYVETGHNISVINEWGLIPNHPDSHRPERVYTLNDIKQGKIWMVATASAVYRNIFLTIDERLKELYYTCPATGDLKISLILSQYGDCYVFARKMSVYRHITTYGTSFNTRAKGKNSSFFWYNVYIGSIQFMKDGFDIEITFKHLMSEVTASSIAFWILHLHQHDVKNYQIMVSILKDYRHRFENNSILFNVLPNVPIQVGYMLGSKYLPIIRGFRKKGRLYK